MALHNWVPVKDPSGLSCLLFEHCAVPALCRGQHTRHLVQSHLEYSSKAQALPPYGASPRGSALGSLTFSTLCQGQERGAALTQRSSCPASSPVTSQRGQKPGAMGRSGGKAGRPGRGWSTLTGTTRLGVIPATWWQSQVKGHHGDQFSELRGQVAPPPGAPLEHTLIHGRAQSGLGLGPGLPVNPGS